MSVNRPTNVRQRDQDINQKLQLYGIFTAFSNGKVPSNKQIDVALNSALASRALANPSQKLSAEGRQLVADLRDVIEQAKYLLLTKNEGNLLQDFIWQTQQLAGNPPNAQLPGAPVDKETAKQHGNQVLEGLRTLGTLVITNGQFRKLLSDATVLLRDMAGDAAQKAATKVNPSDEDLNRIDEPAEDDTWHDTPDLSRENIKGQLKSKAPLSKGDLKDAAGDASEQAQGTRDPQAGAEYAAQQKQQGQDAGTDPQGGAKAAASTLKNKLSANIPDEHKDRAREKKEQTKQRTKDYLHDKFHPERRDQTIYRLKKMVVEIQGHPDYQNAIDTLLSLAEEYAGHSKNLTQQTAGTVKSARSEHTNLQMAEADLKTLIERFANSTSADDLLDAINHIYTDADRDPELKKWFRQMDHYIRKCLKEKGFIMQDSATDEWNQLYDHGNYLLRDRYRDHTNRLIDEFTFLGNQFDADPQNKRFANSVQKLFQELGNDENGKPTFKPHLVKDLSTVILPGAFESVSYVPIPRIEYSDPQFDAIVENLVIESDNLMPNSFEIASDNYFRWGRKTVANRNKNKIMVSVSGVQMDLKDVSYYVKKKAGFPSLMDKGVMDIFLGGTGFGFKMALETADSTDRQHFFKVNTVVVDVKNLQLKVKQSHHKLLFNLFKPLMLKVLTPVITKVLEKVIKDNVNKVDGMAYGIYQEAQRAQDAVKDDPQNAPNIYSRYVNAAQTKMMRGKQKTQNAAANKQVNVAMTQYDSIFKDIRLPGGISTKATEYKELARKGDQWESPVFGLGSARETTDLPRVTPVSRKPHNAASGGVRGPQNVEGGETTLGGAQPRSGGTSGYDQSYGEGTTTGGYSRGNTTTGGYTQGSAGYPDRTTAGSGQPNGSAGFSTQVNQAFGNDAQDLSLKDNAGTVNGGVTQPYSGHTTLGMNNPVLRGTS